jgi:hypothetical protein
LLGSLALVGPAAAGAQELDEATTAQAQRHFETGSQAFDTGDYELAIAEFRRAHELTGHPDLLFNIYSAAERAGRLEEAAEALARHLEEAQIAPERRPVLEQRLARLRARMERAHGTAEGAGAREGPGDGAEEVVGEGPEPPDTTGSEPSDATSAAEPSAPARPANAGPRGSADAPRTGSGSVHPAALATLVAAGVLAASFGVFAALSEVEDQSLASSCGRDATVSCGDDDLSALRVYNTVADVSWIGATVAGVAGVILLLALPTAGGDGAVAASPWVAPGAGGLSAAGRF